MECKPREEMLIQGICEEEVVLTDALIEVGVGDIGVM
jgi:hypothetical protein